MTKERIEIIRQSLIPFVKKELLEINYDGLGKSDATEFEKDLNEVLDLAIKVLEQQTSDDCVSRQAAIKELKESAEHHANNTREEVLLRRDRDIIRALPPVTPTFPKGATNGDVLKIVFPNIEWEETHDIKGDKRIGCTNKFWNAPYKRGSENGSN